ncbi:PIG-L family deacetylase [Romboutsia maritimum]|nr:PIG-L family deacetylase [Romboutsia maritimum]
MNINYKTMIVVSIVVCMGLLVYKPNKLTDCSNKISGIYNKTFEKYVVFYPQHQDDEVLWGGSAIIEAIRQNGSDNVYVVLVSDGSGVNVFKDKKYENLTRKEKECLRNHEFKAALTKLGVKESNTIILPQVDGKVGTHFDTMENVALEFEKKYKSVTHIAHSYKYDDHIMHVKNGEVIQNLYEQGKIKHALYFLKPTYLDNVNKDKRVIYITRDKNGHKAVKKACLEYQVKDENINRHGIGYTSAHSYFDKLLNDEYLTSVLHLPIEN